MSFLSRNIVKIAISLVLAFASYEVEAQNVSGYVRDGKGSPVPYATVVFSADSLASTILSYGITNNDGRYEINAGKVFTPFWVSVGCLGYEKHKRLCHEIKAQMDIEISESSVFLEEVVVKGSMSGVMMRQDTVIYNPKAFTTGSEQSLEELVNKMPGMTVDQSGNVSYQGKKIGKVLVDGKDILSGVGGSALRTLSSDFATSIELIANYSDGGIENSFLSNETMALNIKSDGNNNAVGTFEAGGGFKDKYDIKTSVLKTKEPLSVSAIVNTNNTNEPVFSALDYINAVGGLDNVGATSERAATISLSGPAERRMLVPSNNEHKNTAGIANLNLSYEPNSRYRLDVGAIYNRSMSESSSFRKEEYNLSDNAFFNQAENSKEQANDFASIVINQKWGVSSKTDLRTYTKVNYGHYDINSITNNFFDGTHIDADENDNVKSMNILQQVSLNSLIGRGLLYGNMDFKLNHTLQDFHLLTDAKVPDSFQIEDNVYQTKSTEKNFVLNANLGIIYPILGSEINFKGQITGDYKNDNINVVAAVNERDEKIETKKISAYAGIMKNKGIFRFDAGTYLTNYAINTPYNVLKCSQKRYWGFEPVLYTGIHFSKQHKLLFSTSYSMQPADVNSLYRTTFLKGYNTIQLASECNDFLNRSWNTDFTYQYFDLFSRTTLFLYAMYEKEYNTCQTEYFSDGIVNYTKFVDGGENQSFSSSFYLNKGINGTPLDIKTTANYTYTMGRMLRESIPMESVLGVLNTSLGISSRFRSFPVNFELKGIYNLINNKIDALDVDVSNKEYGGSLQLTYAQDGFTVSLTGKTSKTTNSNYEYNLNDMDFLLSYKIKKFKLKIFGSNIFHLNGREWLTEQVTPNMVSYTKYIRHSGYVLLSVSYSL